MSKEPSHDQSIVKEMKKIKQQLDFLERKIDLLLEHRSESDPNKKRFSSSGRAKKSPSSRNYKDRSVGDATQSYGRKKRASAFYDDIPHRKGPGGKKFSRGKSRSLRGNKSA